MTTSTRPRDLLALMGFLALCLGAGGLGGWSTAQSVGSWYPTLVKPPFNPPAWIFGPVWTTLYVFMGVAAWRVWRKAGWGTPLTLFAIQLALNSLWSFLFFGLRSPGLALLDIVPLLAFILLTWRAFRPIDRPAAALLVPYAAWVSFALLLNASIWWLNRA
jgi:benzodiazapine receptor